MGFARFFKMVGSCEKKLMNKAIQYPLFDRNKIKFKSVEERWSKINITKIAIKDYQEIPETKNISEEIRKARQNDRPVVLVMGAHPVKNGCCLLINDLIREGYITHVATNGAGSIHDWEFAKFGKSTECVRTNVNKGEFGIWQETGQFFGMAIARSYGVGVGPYISNILANNSFRYPWNDYSVQAQCGKVKIPFTIHPGIGQDIIYSHPKVSNFDNFLKDWLIFCESIRNLEGGVFINAGSTVMGPMIFEKALSMARNVEQQEEREIKNFTIVVNDIAESKWNWENDKEPPIEHPDYYLRWMKTFHRMGAKNLWYCKVDNRLFFQGLCKNLL